jgi:hypothetical protein
MFKRDLTAVQVQEDKCLGLVIAIPVASPIQLI